MQIRIFFPTFEMQILLEKILILKNPLTRRRKSSDEVQNLLKGPIKVLHDTYRICARVRRLPRAHYKQPAWGVIEKQTQTPHLFFHTWKILNDLPATLIKHFWILIFRLCLYFFFSFLFTTQRATQTHTSDFFIYPRHELLFIHSHSRSPSSFDVTRMFVISYLSS